MCQECRSRFQQSVMFRLKVERPQEILLGPITPPVSQSFIVFKNAYDNYVAHLGEAALDHVPTKFDVKRSVDGN